MLEEEMFLTPRRTRAYNFMFRVRAVCVFNTETRSTTLKRGNERTNVEAQNADRPKNYTKMISNDTGKETIVGARHESYFPANPRQVHREFV